MSPPDGPPKGDIGFRRVRLPLQVGTSANYSLARASVPIFLGGLCVVLLIAAFGEGLEVSRRGGDWFREFALWLCLMVPSTFLVAYGCFHIYGAIDKRASDIVLTRDGLRVDGGPSGGTRIDWSELAPPFAYVKATEEVHLKLVRILIIVPVALIARTLISPRGPVRIWRLWIVRRDRELCVSKTDRDNEARSMEAAASSIAAAIEGRRYVASAPTVEVQVAHCPHCGAPAVPEDADEVDCRHCGHSVPLSPEVRGQAAAVAARQEQRRRSSRTVARILEQPRASRANLRLLPLWLVMLTASPLCLALLLLYDGYGLNTTVGGVSKWYLLAVPPAIVLSCLVLGGALTVSRGALQSLTLGFGALAPEREGAPARCRRCQAPLAEQMLGGVSTCRYCSADNVVGIDLRPFVDKARAEMKSFDGGLRDRNRRRVAWLAAGMIALPIAVLANTANVWAFRALWAHEQNMQCDAGDNDACQGLFDRAR